MYLVTKKAMHSSLYSIIILFMFRYIRSKTKNLIANMFTEPVPPDSKLVISNALYFNGMFTYRVTHKG